jgi:hypothetical protein
MGKDKDTMLNTAKEAVVDTGAVVVETAKAGLKGAKELAVSAGSVAGDAVIAVAKRVRKAVSKRHRMAAIRFSTSGLGH